MLLSLPRWWQSFLWLYTLTPFKKKKTQKNPLIWILYTVVIYFNIKLSHTKKKKRFCQKKIFSKWASSGGNIYRIDINQQLFLRTGVPRMQNCYCTWNLFCYCTWNLSYCRYVEMFSMTAVHSRTELQHKLKLCSLSSPVLCFYFPFLLGRAQTSHPLLPPCYSTLNSAFGYESCCNNLSDTDKYQHRQIPIGFSCPINFPVLFWVEGVGFNYSS